MAPTENLSVYQSIVIAEDKKNEFLKVFILSHNRPLCSSTRCTFMGTTLNLYAGY